MMAEDPYAFDNLLAAGTVLLHFEPEAATATHLPEGASDDWGSLDAFMQTHGLQLTSSSHYRLVELSFLIQHKFVRATWRTLIRVRFHVHVRVYLIPFDLPGVCGCLAARNRDEYRVLLPARKALTSLLTNTDRSAGTWLGNATPGDIFDPFISQKHDLRTLSEIYSDLPSPTIDASTFLSGAHPTAQIVLKDALHWDAPPGMRPLYTYQRRTVARMLQQELDPGVAPDPLYIPIRDVHDAKTFFLQPSTMEVLRETPLCFQPRGGILCEEMGTGKTCMVLGLIMATRRQISSPDEGPWDAPERPVLTPLAFRHFLSPQFERARSAARAKTGRASLPSLVEVLTHYIRASPEAMEPGYDVYLQERCPHLWEALVRNQPFYHVYEHVPATASLRRKGGVNRGPRKVYLTSATLVAVPRAILEQWNAEINKHCEGGSLRVLYLDSGDKASAMPPARELASNYDVILMSHERFAGEKTRCDPSSLYTWQQCKCPGSCGTRSQSCTCPTPESVSPLVQIRWKRLVVDEGHVSIAQSNLARLCRELNVERRWIVSGTPTRNLMGLSLGQSDHAESQEANSVEGDEEDDEDDDVASLSNNPPYSGELVYPCDATDDEGAPGGENDDPFSREKGAPYEAFVDGRRKVLGLPGRRWTRVDRDDLQKLGDMIAKFISVAQFAHEKDLFRKRVSAPLLDPNGPSFGAIQVVSQVMAQVMFRHQIQDVERELPEKLPTLKEKTVTLKFQPLAAKSYNVLQSLIAVNAVDSERKDQDYLFHRRNRAALRELLENLTQTMFFRTAADLTDLDKAVDRSEEALKVARTRKLPESDILLLKESNRVQHEAAIDLVWRSINEHEDIPFIVRGLSSALRVAWLKLDNYLFEDEVPLMDADRICTLRHILHNSPLASEQRLIEHGHDVAAEDAKNASHYEEYIRSRKRKRRQDGDAVESLKLRQANANAGSKEKQQELSKALTAGIVGRERGGTEGPPTLFPPLRGPIPSRTHSLSPYVGNSPSSKINYILRKVLKHAAKHKFLIFSAFPLSLVYVADALQVAQVPYLQYTSGVKPRVRQQTVVTFETSDKYRVLLMELKLGARGLNLVTASRIIFCEPVWQADVESQAIKRAHRIGQKSDQIKVSTLVMQGTSEEAMVTRRHALQRKSQRLPAMEEDVGMSKFLQNPTFIKSEDIEPPDCPGLDIPLVPGAAARPSGQMEPMPITSIRQMDVDVDAPGPSLGAASQSDLQEVTGPPLKKVRMVRFG